MVAAGCRDSSWLAGTLADPVRELWEGQTYYRAQWVNHRNVFVLSVLHQRRHVEVYSFWEGKLPYFRSPGSATGLKRLLAAG